MLPTRPAPNVQPAPAERIAGGYARHDSELIPVWQPPPIPAPPIRAASDQNGGANTPMASTHNAPNASPQVSTHEKCALLDLPSDRGVPRVASGQLALVEPHLEPGRPEGVADALRGVNVLGFVAYEDGR